MKRHNVVRDVDDNELAGLESRGMMMTLACNGAGMGKVGCL